MYDVLIVDDNKDILQIMKEYLTINGIQVVGTAENGYDAVTQYKIHEPDSILLDVYMPKFDGIYALEKIRDEDKNVKIIMITGNKDSKTREKMSMFRPTAIFYKPPDLKKIIEIIKK